MEVNHFSSLI